ncbi:MAG: 50S ribosomal protein L22 [Phycisphaerales bacterium]|nr:MAG: 50S ribosomal protein L22 [Phycisphaerales bacterium]
MNGFEWCAKHRFARISPSKVRLVMDLVRGRPCDEALELLRFNRRRAAGMIGRVIKSAMASADEAEANMRNLYISEARVDSGPAYPRWRPKDRGRAHPILKRTSHIFIGVTDK